MRDDAGEAYRPSDALVRILRAFLPERALRTLESLWESQAFHTYLVNGHQVLRIPRHARAARALAREGRLLPRIAGALPVDVPLPTYVGDPARGGISFCLHERVRGTMLTRAVWEGLPRPVRSRLAGQVGGFLKALHGLDVGIARACGVEEIDHRARMDAALDRLRGRAGRAVGAALRAALDARLVRCGRDPALWDYDPRLLHTAVAPGRVLAELDRVQVIGIIHWGEVRIGDPAHDFIHFREAWGPDFLSLALDGYAVESEEAPVGRRIHLRSLVARLERALDKAFEGPRADVEEEIAGLAGALLEVS